MTKQAFKTNKPELQKYFQVIKNKNWPQTVLLELSDKHFANISAIALARAVLCDKPGIHGACGQCDSCKVPLTQHPDYIALEIQPEATTIKIQQVRDMLQRTNNSAQITHTQVVYINRCDNINTQAANALLKTLEEPKDNLYFILYAEKPAAILPTIHSRCIQIRLQWQASGTKNTDAWLDLLENAYPLMPSLQQSMQENSQLENIFTTLWQIWPSKYPISLSEKLKENSAAEIIQCMQIILQANMSQKLKLHGSAQRVYDNLHGKYGKPALAKYSIIAISSLFDNLLEKNKLIQSNTVATGEYLLDDIILCTTN